MCADAAGRGVLRLVGEPVEASAGTARRAHDFVVVANRLPVDRVESPDGGSILITSAPRSARTVAQKGPAMNCVTSRTRTPSRARGCSGARWR